MKKEVPQHEMVLLGPKLPQFQILKTRVYKKISKTDISICQQHGKVNQGILVILQW